jgi:hypothetical protein
MAEDNDNNLAPAVLTRRKMFGMLAMTGAGLLASTPRASGFFNIFQMLAPAPPGTLDRMGIPEEWRARLGPHLPAYAHYLKTLNLRHLTVRQIIDPHRRTRGKILNTLPPKSLWRQIRETARVIDSLSKRLELQPSEVVSAYRTPAYNRSCRGARHSRHLVNNAIDIQFPCSPGKVTAMAREMRAAGLFRGGVGLYRGFTHIDTRGSNVDWRR